MRLLFAFFFLLFSSSTCAQGSTSRKVLLLMGSRFELVAISDNESERVKAIDLAIQEIQRIEHLISSWQPDSETSRINLNAGIQPVKVSKELFDLILRSIKVSDLTEGAFDISFNSMDQIWIFDGREMEPPDSSLITGSVKKIDYRNIILDRVNQTVFLKEKGMKIGFGAIGKGYAANKSKEVMLENGIKNGLINAGGDLIAWGKQENSEPWQIGIADPTKKTEFIAWLSASNLSVVTSGNYEKFVIINGKRYGHIINPKTGYPAEGIISVTVVSPDAELSDALATSVFVLGIDNGLALINRLKNIECLIVDDQNKIWTSDKLQLNYY